MSGVVCQLAEHLHVQRPHVTLAATVDDLVDLRFAIVRRDAAHLAWCAARTEAMVSERVSVNDRSGVPAIPICWYVRPVTAWSNHTPST